VRPERQRRPSPLSAFCEPGLDLTRVVEELSDSGALAVPVLGDEARLALLAAANEGPYRPARTWVGKGERRVCQRMEVCDHFPADSIFRAFAAEFEKLWADWLVDAPADPFEGDLSFNDFMLQRYSVGELGITPHRDRTGYRNLVCLFVLEGKGRFYVCDDRSGGGARQIPHGAGDVILMRAPGFQGSGERPFHFVRAIESPRTVFGLRQECG